VPDQSVLAAGRADGEDYIHAARAEDGNFLIAYLPTGRPMTVALDKLSAKKVKAQWYDPRKGTWSLIGAFDNSANRKFEAPSTGEKDDWVLVLEDAAKTFPPQRAN
jgi:hypothetical protein